MIKKRFDLKYYIKKSFSNIVINNKTSNYIFYIKHEQIIFKYNINTNTLWISYINFWNVFDNNLYISEKDKKILFKTEFEKFFNIKNPTLLIGDVYFKNL